MINNQRFYSFLLLFLILLISLVFLNLAITVLDPRVAEAPILVSCILIVLTIGSLIQERRAGRKDTVPAKEGSDNDAAETVNRSWWFMLILSVIYVIVVTVAGFFIATVVFLLVAPYLFRYKNWKVIILSCVILIFMYWIGFEKLMNIRLPGGILFS